MKGFRDFLLRGNLVELAVAFIMGTVFAAVVKSFTDMVMDIVGLFGGVPNFASANIYGIGVGAFLSAVLTLVLTGAVIYFLIVVPYNKLSEITKKDDPEVAASTEDLLAEIRDLLREQNGRHPATGTPTTGNPATDPRTPPADPAV